MFDEILVCLDGSPLAERYCPWRKELRARKGSAVILLRVLRKQRGIVRGRELYARARPRFPRAHQISDLTRDPAIAIIEELDKNPRAIAAFDHAWPNQPGEALLGKRGLKVIRGARRPVLLYRARSDRFSYAHKDHHPGGGPGP